MPIEFHRDGPWDLPKGWVWARAGDVLPLEYGKGLPERVRDNSGQVPVYGSAGRVGTHSECLVDNPCLVIARKGSVGAIYEETGPSWPIDTVYYARDSAAVFRRFAYWFFSFWRLDRLDQSTAVPSLSRDNYNEVLVPIAPLAEQRRIVARIDELFTEIADGETSLARARDDLDTWRRALLKAAVTGELTREWREGNRANEPAISVIEALRGTRINLKGGSREQKVVPVASAELPKLPQAWTWTSLSDLAETIRNGTSIVPRSDKNQNEVLRISAVRPLSIDLSQIRYLDDEQAKDAAAFKVESGDLLFTRYNGSADLVGVGAKYRDAPRFYPDKLIRVRLKEEVREYADFIEVAVNTWVSRRHIAANIKTTAGQQGISGESLKATPIPLPPRSEAVVIIQQINAADDADVRTEFTAAETDSSQLRQSVLKAAFEGRLVEQEPRDEPAERLLARLSEQQETDDKATKHRVVRRKTKGVIAGFDPAIHAAAQPAGLTRTKLTRRARMDARVKPAHDE